MTGPRKGVNCSNCGCRLPADYRGACPDCDALSIDFAQTGEPVADSGLILWSAYCDKKMELEAANDRIAALKAAGDGLAEALSDAGDYIRGGISGPAQREGIMREAATKLAAWEALTND